MLPISPSAEIASSVPASTPSIPHRVPPSSTGNTSSTTASMSPASGIATPVTSCSAGPTASTASASGRTTAFGTEMSTERPSSWDSAVPAVPEPMLASSRSASSWRLERAVRRVGVLSGAGSGGDTGRVTRAGGVDRIAVDDQCDAAVGEHRAAGHGGGAGDAGRERAGDQLALADQPGDGEGQATVLAADDHGVVGVLGGQAAEGARAVEQRQDAVPKDEHPPPGDGADGLVGEA